MCIYMQVKYQRKIKLRWINKTQKINIEFNVMCKTIGTSYQPITYPILNYNKELLDLAPYIKDQTD